MSEKYPKKPTEGQQTDKYPETVKSSPKSLLISLDPKTPADKKLAFVSAVLGEATKITQSVDEQGKFNNRFYAAVSGGKNAGKNPNNLHLMCFTEGHEEVEMTAVETRARAIATQLGVNITGMERTNPPAELLKAQESRENITGGRFISGIMNLPSTGVLEANVTVTNRHGLHNLSDRAAFLLGINQVLKIQVKTFLEGLAQYPQDIQGILQNQQVLNLLCHDAMFLLVVFNGEMSSVRKCLDNGSLALDMVKRFLKQCVSGKLNLAEVIAKVNFQKITDEELVAAQADEARSPFQITYSGKISDTPKTSIECAMRHMRSTGGEEGIN